MTTASDQISRPVGGGDEDIKFYVNGEEVVFSYQKPDDRQVFTLKVREILAIAGFTPPEDYELTRAGDREPYASLDDEVAVEFGDHFTATHKGPTPTS